jgi:hypothetical protein
MNRCINTGLGRSKPYLNPQESSTFRGELDEMIEQQIIEWNANVPATAEHNKKDNFNHAMYARGLAETAIRIRLLRVIESKAIAEIAKVSPESARVWAEYECDEMLHDEMFIQDLEIAGVSRKEFLEIEPYMSTKLLVGFFSYLLDHEGPLGVVAYSYLVEYVNVKLEPAKLAGLEDILGRKAIAGQIAHSHTDINHDHPGMVWGALRYLINSEEDKDALKLYLKEFQKLLAMFFVEINSEFGSDNATAKKVA